VKLTWKDLIVEDVSPKEFADWMRPWSGVVSGRVALAFLNRFGVWFLRRPEGPVDMLDVLTGTVERVADNHEAFIAEVNGVGWQETYLASKVVLALHQVGKVPGPKQCYAVTPPVALGGPNPMAGERVPVENVMVMDIPIWQSLCAQALGREA